MELEVAALRGDLETVRTLVEEQGFIPPPDIMFPVAQRRHYPVLRYFLSGNFFDEEDYERMAIQAARLEDLNYLRLLIETDHFFPTSNFIVSMVRIGNLNFIKYVLDNHLVTDFDAAIFAATLADSPILKFLLSYPQAWESMDSNSAIESLTDMDNNVLIFDTSVPEERQFQLILKRNQIKALKFYLTDSRFDPSLDNNLALNNILNLYVQPFLGEEYDSRIWNYIAEMLKILLTDPRVFEEALNNDQYDLMTLPMIEFLGWQDKENFHQYYESYFQASIDSLQFKSLRQALINAYEELDLVTIMKKLISDSNRK